LGALKGYTAREVGGTISKLSGSPGVFSRGSVGYTVEVMNAVGDGTPLVFAWLDENGVLIAAG
jgi:hypothetical protein